MLWKRYSRSEAGQHELTREHLEHVIEATRFTVLLEFGLLFAATIFCKWIEENSYGPAVVPFQIISGFLILATFFRCFSVWAHFKDARAAREDIHSAIAKSTTPVDFWRDHDGLFPLVWR